MLLHRQDYLISEYLEQKILIAVQFAVESTCLMSFPLPMGVIPKFHCAWFQAHLLEPLSSRYLLGQYAPLHIVILVFGCFLTFSTR